MSARKTALRLAMVIGAMGIVAATADRAMADRPDSDRNRSYERRDGGHDRDNFRDRDGRWDRGDFRDRDYGRRDRDDWRRPVYVPVRTYAPVCAPAPVYAPVYAPTGIRCGNGAGFTVQTSRTIITISIGGW